MGMVEKAERFATKAHTGQRRKYTGEAYIVHPQRVAGRVNEYTENDAVVAAAWLHDVLEDCGVSLKEIEETFGLEVSQLVFELTNASKDMPWLSRERRKAMDRESLKQSSTEAHLIKVIDRIDNLNDINLAPATFRSLYAKESLLLASALTKAPVELLKELKELANESNLQGGQRPRV